MADIIPLFNFIKQIYTPTITHNQQDKPLIGNSAIEKYKNHFKSRIERDGKDTTLTFEELQNVLQFAKELQQAKKGDRQILQQYPWMEELLAEGPKIDITFETLLASAGQVAAQQKELEKLFENKEFYGQVAKAHGAESVWETGIDNIIYNENAIEAQSIKAQEILQKPADEAAFAASPLRNRLGKYLKLYAENGRLTQKNYKKALVSLYNYYTTGSVETKNSKETLNNSAEVSEAAKYIKPAELYILLKSANSKKDYLFSELTNAIWTGDPAPDVEKEDPNSWGKARISSLDLWTLRNWPFDYAMEKSINNELKLYNESAAQFSTLLEKKQPLKAGELHKLGLGWLANSSDAFNNSPVQKRK